MSVLCVKKTADNAIIPTYDSTNQYALYACEDLVVKAEQVNSINLRISISFPHNYAGLIVDNGVVKTLAGLIDSDYRGEVNVLATSNKDVAIKRGQHVANLILIEIAHPKIVVEEQDSEKEEDDKF